MLEPNNLVDAIEEEHHDMNGFANEDEKQEFIKLLDLVYEKFPKSTCTEMCCRVPTCLEKIVSLMITCLIVSYFICFYLESIDPDQNIVLIRHLFEKENTNQDNYFFIGLQPYKYATKNKINALLSCPNLTKAARIEAGNLRQIHDYGFTPPQLFNGTKLKECEGDCDGDSECAPGLVCFQRNYINVTSCIGEAVDFHDYCIKNKTASKTDYTALKTDDDVFHDCLIENYLDYHRSEARDELQTHTWAYSIFDIDGDFQVSKREFVSTIVAKEVNIHTLFTDSEIKTYTRRTRSELRTVAELLDLLDCVDLNENNIIDFNEFVCKFSKNQTIAVFDKSCAYPTTFVRITWEELGTLIGVTGLQWCVLGLLLDRYAVLHDIHNPNTGWIGTLISVLGALLFTLENLLVIITTRTYGVGDGADTNHPISPRSSAFLASVDFLGEDLGIFILLIILFPLLSCGIFMLYSISLHELNGTRLKKLKQAKKTTQTGETQITMKAIIYGLGYMVLAFAYLFYDIVFLDEEVDFLTHFITAITQGYVIFTALWLFCVSSSIDSERLTIHNILHMRFTIWELYFVGTCFLYTSIIMMQLSTKSLFLLQLFLVAYYVNFSVIYGWFVYFYSRKMPPPTLSPKSPKVLFDSYHNGYKYFRGFPKEGYLLLVKRHDSKKRTLYFENVANNINEPFKLIVSQESESHGGEALRCLPSHYNCRLYTNVHVKLEKDTEKGSFFVYNDNIICLHEKEDEMSKRNKKSVGGGKLAVFGVGEKDNFYFESNIVGLTKKCQLRPFYDTKIRKSFVFNDDGSISPTDYTNLVIGWEDNVPTKKEFIGWPKFLYLNYDYEIIPTHYCCRLGIRKRKIDNKILKWQKWWMKSEEKEEEADSAASRGRNNNSADNKREKDEVVLGAKSVRKVIPINREDGV